MTGDVTQRIAVTIGALLLFRLGEWIPLPGVNAEAWAALTRGHGSGLVAFLGASSGGARRLAIFALGLVPYVSAAVLMQLATIFSGRLRARAREGESGRAAMVRYTRYLTVLLAAAQALGIANAVEHVSGVVTIPGALFIVSTVLTLTGGTLFLAWLAEQITARGIGNGIALILFTGIVTEIPAALAYAIEVMRQYGTSNGQIAVVALIVVAVTAGVVAMELARRKLPVRYSARQIGLRKLDEQLSYLSLKLNPAGIVPVLLASFVLSVLALVGGFLTGSDPGLLAWISPGRLSHLLIYAVLIVFCTFFYTASVLDPEEAAERVKALGGVIPGVALGGETAAYLDRVVSRTTVIGAIYLALVVLLPEILIYFARVPVYFGGTALLISVCTILDLQTEFRAETQLA